MGTVIDARGSCLYGIESRATSSCAVVKRESSQTSKRYTNCAAALTGWKHREEHPERTAEARRRLGDGRRRRKRRRRQKRSEARKKVTREVIPPNSNSNRNWPVDACGALRRRVGGHRPARRRRGRPQDHRGDQFGFKWIARAMSRLAILGRCTLSTTVLDSVSCGCWHGQSMEKAYRICASLLAFECMGLALQALHGIRCDEVLRVWRCSCPGQNGGDC